MTSVKLPSLVIELFAAELAHLQKELITQICADYDLPTETLIEKYVSGNIDVISSKNMRLSVVKCQAEVPIAERCKARIWNSGAGGRCKRRVVVDSELCVAHNKIASEKPLKYGLVTEPRPPGIFPKNTRITKLH